MTAIARTERIEPETGPARVGGVREALLKLDGTVWVEPALRVLVQMRTAQLECAPEQLARHVREAISLGETHARVVHLGRWHDSPLFDKRERAALTVADALAGRATNGALQGASRCLEPRELVHLALACAATAARARFEPIERSQT